ncbi:retrovirus-related pol polyprotein from transposon TNT 1-94 [Tanacetum coccineum]
MLCKPKPYYNEHNKVAIGYKNPLCLTRAKQVQPALYNGYEIIKNNHVPALVHNTEDTVKIAEITRRKINDKMKDPECVTHKVKIAPPDYSKENYLATFTPQKQLTPEQIIWSQDLIKMKEKALKEQTTAARPIKALTVYLPNTPATLIPRVLPRKREMGFEQTKEYYLTDVIPFFKTLKEHFEGIQKALTKEIKEMKDVFEELEAEVHQNDANRKHDEIERKNLLIANDNLIVDCLSKEVFYIATNSELIVSRFTEMHEAHTIVQTRSLELETKLSKLRDNVKKDDHTELVKRFSNLEITRAKHIEQTTSLLNENENLKAQIHENLKVNTIESVKLRVLALGRYAIDVEPIPPHYRNNREVHLHYLKHLKESVETLCEIVKEAKVERPFDRSLASACLYTKHSQELLEYVIGTCPKAFNQRDKKHAPTPVIRKKQVTFKEQCDTSNSNTHKHVEQLNTQKTNVPVPPSTGVNCCTNASGSQPRSNTKKNRISPAKGVNKKKVEEHPRINKSNLRTTNHVDSSSSSKRTLSKFRNLNKLGKYGNPQEKCLPVVYYVEGLGNNLFSVGQFCDSDLEVAFRKHSCYIRDTNCVELIKSFCGSNLYTISIEDIMKSSPICLLSKASKNKSWLWHRRLNHLNFGTINDLARKDLVRGLPRLKLIPRTPQQNDIVERQNRTLVEAARTMLIFSKASMFLWAEAVATSCYTKNRSLIHTLHNKTPYELVHDKKPDLTFFCVFGALCYPTNDSEDLGKLQPTADIGIFIGYAPSRKGYRIYNKRTR